MKLIRRTLIALALMAGLSPVVAQQFPTIPAQSVIGRLGIPGDTGPSQAIPFSKLSLLTGLDNALPVFKVGSAAYPTAQSAVNAAVAAHGGWVYFPCGNYDLGSGAVGLTYDDAAVPIRLTGPANVSSGNSCVVITYEGIGTMISARHVPAPEIDHLFLYAPNAAKIIDLSGSVASPIVGSTFAFVHDNFMQNAISNPSAIGIDIDGNQGAIVEHNFIAIVGGTGISGTRAAGHFVIGASISKNVFGASGRISISGLGNNVTIDRNIAESPTEAFIKPGPAGTCQGLTVSGNWIGDFTVPSTDALVHSNCKTLISLNNTYANAVGSTQIKQDNSTGSVFSVGDDFEGSNGIDIGTGNTLSLHNPIITFLSGSKVLGTPASTLTADFYGALNVTGGNVAVSYSQNAASLSQMVNQNAGASSAAKFIATSDVAIGSFGASSSTFSSALFTARVSMIANAGSSGLVLDASGANPVIIASNDVETMRVLTGVMVPGGVTGGDKGAGTVNISGGYYKAGTLMATGAAGQLPGTATNDNASAGNVGEYVESVIASGSAVALVTATAKTVTSISLTAGDWDVDALGYILPAATTSVTNVVTNISGTTNTLDTTAGKINGLTFQANVSGGASYSTVVPPYRLSLSGTTTVFLVAQSTFTVSTASAFGIIRARRAR